MFEQTFRVAAQSSYYNPRLPPPELVIKFVLNPDRINDMSAVRGFAAWDVECVVCRHADRPRSFAERMLPGPTTTIIDRRPPWVSNLDEGRPGLVSGNNWEPMEEPTRGVTQHMIEEYEEQEERARQSQDTRPQRQGGSSSSRAEPEIGPPFQ